MERMLNILLIHENRSAILTVPQILADMNIAPVAMVLEEFHPEFLVSNSFDLMVFELFGENRSCLAILKQLEQWTATSGTEVPPVMVVTEDSLVEKDLRTAKVNFLFIKPVVKQELILAIQQAKRMRVTGSLSVGP